VAGKQQYSSCFVDDLLVGIKVDSVQEVTAGSELTPVPLASPLVSGLLNLRGQVVTAIDLRRCLELPDRPSGQRPVHVIMRTNDGSVSLLVDQIGDVLQVDEDDFEAPPRTLRGRLRELITGAYKLDGRLLLVLDTNAALAFSTSEQT
jgi:purine-binding chemotaxis protein CheW